MAEKLRTIPPHPENDPTVPALTTEQEQDFALWSQEMATPDAAPAVTTESPDELSPDDQARVDRWKREFSGQPVQSNTELAIEAKQEIASQPDAEVRYKDAELLGRNYPVRQVIHELGVQRAKSLNMVVAKTANALATPGKYRHQLLTKLAEGRHARHESRLQDVAHLPDNHRLKMRRQAKFNRAKAKLDTRQANLAAHTETMANRVRSVHETAEKSRDAYKSKLLERRKQALARRDMRRELKSQGANIFEQNAILKDVPKEHLRAVGHIAVRTETIKREQQVHTKAEKTAQKAETRTASKLESNSAHIQQYESEAAHADKVVKDITEKHLPKAQEHLASLQEHLKGLPEGDPTYAGLAAQVQHAEQQIAMYQQRELPYWQQAAEKRRAAATKLTTENEALSQQRTTHQEAAATASESKEQQQARIDKHAAHSNIAMNNILTGKLDK